jgi:hypothetical protein
MGADQPRDRGVTGSPAQQATLRLSPLAPPGKPGAAQEPGARNGPPASLAVDLLGRVALSTPYPTLAQLDV